MILRKNMENVLNFDQSHNSTNPEDIQAIIAGSIKEQAIFLSNILFKRKYLKQKINLQGKYWNDDKYRKEFQFYIMKSLPLVKRYGFQAIYNVLQTKKGQNVWSPNCSWMIPDFEKEKARLHNQKLLAETQKTTIMKVEESLPIFKINKEEKINRLDNLD